MSKKWKARTTAPELTNKYYITTAGGGYNKCIAGNDSTNKEKNRPTQYFAMPNCVGYVYGRSLEIANKSAMDMPTCNAEDWNDMSKWEHGTEPKLGAIICYRSGKNWNSSDGCGHVAVVEQVNSDGSFLISESGWSSFYFRTKTIPKSKAYGSGLTFECFLYNPYADNNYEEVAETKTETKSEPVKVTSAFLPAKGYWQPGDKDDNIAKLAQFMYDTFPAYTKKAALGPVFGPNLKASIVEFQKRTGLEADGCVGPITLAELVKYGFDSGDVPVTTKASEPTQVTYTVKNGDSLWRIAQQYNTTVAKIVAANNIANPNLITVGQVLVIK